MERKVYQSSKANPRTPLSRFFDEGLALIQSIKATDKRDPSVAMSPWSNRDDWLAWGHYFMTKYGGVPKAFAKVEDREIDSFTFPAQRPELFDLTYAPPEYPAYVPRLKVDRTAPRTPEEIAMADKLVALFKRGLTPPVERKKGSLTKHPDQSSLQEFYRRNGLDAQGKRIAS